jgi:mono/diheme cytochrome c family protein
VERRGHIIVIVVVLLVLVLALAVALTRPAAALPWQTDVVPRIGGEPGCGVALPSPIIPAARRADRSHEPRPGFRTRMSFMPGAVTSSAGPNSDAAGAGISRRVDRGGAALVVALDVKTGRQLAERWCSGCHVAEARSRVDQAPAFETIAKDPLKTSEWLRTWLMTPHSTMPDLTLSRSEVEAIIAYLKSLGDG